MKFLKVGRVAIITRGRYAGKKVVIIQPLDSGSKTHSFPHALVAGIERYPSQITRRMSKARQAKRSKVKPFIKIVNYNHLMPTRYTLELEGLKNVITNDTFKEVSQREEAKKTVKKSLEDRYTTGKNRWFFTPLKQHQNYSHECRTDRRTNFWYPNAFDQQTPITPTNNVHEMKPRGVARPTTSDTYAEETNRNYQVI
ncbi:MAG: hypothetical protein Q9202_003148 [Teloschistes flavicans]